MLFCSIVAPILLALYNLIMDCCSSVAMQFQKMFLKDFFHEGFPITVTRNLYVSGQYLSTLLACVWPLPVYTTYMCGHYLTCVANSCLLNIYVCGHYLTFVALSIHIMECIWEKGPSRHEILCEMWYVSSQI